MAIIFLETNANTRQDFFDALRFLGTKSIVGDIEPLIKAATENHLYRFILDFSINVALLVSDELYHQYADEEWRQWEVTDTGYAVHSTNLN